MYVEKIFSCVDVVNGDTDDRLFSVLMDEEELALFSEFEERLYFLGNNGGTFTTADVYNRANTFAGTHSKIDNSAVFREQPTGFFGKFKSQPKSITAATELANDKSYYLKKGLKSLKRLH